jgi:hypothetical protein
VARVKGRGIQARGSRVNRFRRKGIKVLGFGILRTQRLVIHVAVARMRASTCACRTFEAGE